MKTQNPELWSQIQTAPSLRMESALAGIAGKVHRSRQTFFNDLQQLPRGLRTVIQKNYDQRLARGRGKPMLGEYAPWLLAEVLQIRSRTAIKSVLPPWMNFYAYSLFLDDVLDMENKSDAAPLLVASGLLLERGIARLYEGLAPDTKVRVQLDKYFLESAQAVFREFDRHRNKLHSYQPHEIRGLGEKVSLLKLCAASLLLADGAEKVDEELLLPVGLLATGMQMLDDVADWREDWQSGNYSHLLTQTLVTLRANQIITDADQSDLTEREVFASMVITGTLESYLTTGVNFLRKIIASQKLKPGTRAHMILSAIIQANADMLGVMRAVKQAWIDFSANRPLSRSVMAAFFRKQQTRRNLATIEKRIMIVAQST